MLEQPRAQDVGGHFGEDAALLLVLLAAGVVVLLAGALAAAYARVARVACEVVHRGSSFVDGKRWKIFHILLPPAARENATILNTHLNDPKLPHYTQHNMPFKTIRDYP